MRRKKPFRAMFVSADGKISIQPIKESPARIAGLIRPILRTGADRKQNLFTYEEERQPLPGNAEFLPERSAGTRISPAT